MCSGRLATMRVAIERAKRSSTVRGEDRGERVDVVVVDDLLGGQRLCAVHPHVERGVTPVGEPSLSQVELRAADPEVKQDAHDVPLVFVSDDLGDVFEAAVDDLRPVSEGLELGSGRRHGARITVDAEQAEVRSGFEEGAGVPATSDRRVDDGARRNRGEELGHLPDHDRSVLVATHSFSSPTRGPSAAPRADSVRSDFSPKRSGGAGGVEASPRRPGGCRRAVRPRRCVGRCSPPRSYMPQPWR